MYPKEKGYVLFQEYIPNEGFDYRIEIYGKYCIALIRLARKNDFRASGGHENHYDKEYIQKDVIEFAFNVYNKLKVQSCALDIIRDKNTGRLYLIEISYCFALDPDEFEHGYWDCNGIWYDEKFDFRDWIIEDIINNVKKKHAISSEKL